MFANDLTKPVDIISLVAANPAAVSQVDKAIALLFIDAVSTIVLKIKLALPSATDNKESM